MNEGWERSREEEKKKRVSGWKSKGGKWEERRSCRSPNRLCRLATSQLSRGFLLELFSKRHHSLKDKRDAMIIRDDKDS